MKLTRSVLLVILSAALFVQLVIISYNQATGFIRISGLAEFAVRLSFGSTLTRGPTEPVDGRVDFSKGY